MNNWDGRGIGMQYIVGKIEDFPPLTGRVVHIGNRQIAVFRLSSGEIRAIDNRCPHQRGPLADGIISGTYVFCPLHDRKISLEDGSVQAPDTGCVSTYPVSLKGEDIIIYLVEEKMNHVAF